MTYQLKILTAALFTVAILKRPLIMTQWAALVVLVIGVAMVQLADSEPAKKTASSSGAPEQNRWIGFGAALTACVLSGFAGIYFEKILKVIFLFLSQVVVVLYRKLPSNSPQRRSFFDDRLSG